MEDLIELIAAYRIPLLMSVGLLVFYILFRAILMRLVRLHALRSELGQGRVVYIRKLLNFMLVAMLLTMLGATWEISLKGLSLYFASALTIVGVALFATWSVLSNLTASIILFFFFPYRIGQRVRVHDGDNSAEGIIEDINLFTLKIETDEKSLVIYPTNLAIQKSISILKKKGGR